MRYWGTWVALGLLFVLGGGTACSSSSSNDGSSDDGGTGACIESGQECTSSAESCCTDSICVNSILQTGLAHCAAVCAGPSECNSDCCARLEASNESVCAPAEHCETGGGCAIAGNECSDNSQCCSGSRCVADASSSLGGFCAAECTMNEGCNSGCCALLDDGVTRVCSPAMFCEGGNCTAAGNACTDTTECCADHRCVADPGTTMGVCAAECTDNSQCVSDCCAPLDDGVTSVCSPLEFCAATPGTGGGGPGGGA